MSQHAITLRTRQFVANPLMSRRQFVLDVSHPGRATVSKKEIIEKVAKMFKVKDPSTVIPFSFKTAYGGGKSTGFVCVYNSLEEAKKLHTKCHLTRLGLIDKVERKGRKGIKEGKNRGKKTFGLGRRIARKRAKRAEA